MISNSTKNVKIQLYEYNAQCSNLVLVVETLHYEQQRDSAECPYYLMGWILFSLGGGGEWTVYNVELSLLWIEGVCK